MKKTTKELTTNMVLVSAAIIFLATILYGLFYKPEFDPVDHYEKSASNINTIALSRMNQCNGYKTIDCTLNHISNLKSNIEYSYNVNSSLSLISSVERAQ
ncbi:MULTISPECIES: hypothetical protein [Pseudomonas]|jgi:hypothetical protein|uniref:hypothetical protein n=1 Tax=Pseudomonas TaxID=286 RepID=UPI0015E45349|nr:MULTISPECIES: hypothetical protein [Pseudomonas]MBA1300087.1 hypothetical protein [Pseudomonas carnis]MBJ2202967.1 hypothetical protein [Pseudomonas carnis]MBW9243988.1 hypothetical protein [Pseudomonas paracarnis]ULN82670.1 hypothetical protein HXW87_10950 [Pseudomonas sp. Y5-11]